MKAKIHKTAIVDKKAEIGDAVEIGPYAIIEGAVKIEKNARIMAHAHISSGTQIGEGTEVHMGAVLGHTPQDFAYEEKESFLKIGKRNIIREYVTIHKGTKENSSTVIGDENYFMGASHIGHNCFVGNKVILANGALLAGHVQVEDGVFISGNVAIHQFCRIGRLSMVGGFSGVNQDVPPYMVVRGPSKVRAVNIIGLRRAGFKREVIREIKEAFKLLYRSGLNTRQATEKIMGINPSPEILHMVDFIKESKRGICDYHSADEASEKFFEV